VNGQYVIFFIPETSIYTFYDRFDRPPMRPVLDDDVICQCHTITNAHLVVDALNHQGLI